MYTLPQTNHPQINVLIKLFESESQPFRKIHRMIDLFETIIKTHTASIVCWYLDRENISDTIRKLLAESLQTPSLGTWQYFSVETMKEIKKQHLGLFVKGFEEYFKKWKKDVNTVIETRNKYAHGATPPDDVCLKKINELIPILDTMLKAEWLALTTVVAFWKIDGKLTPILVEGATKELYQNFGVYNIQQEINPNDVYLVGKEGVLVRLFPLMVVDFVDNNEKKEVLGLYFFNDLRSKRKVSLLNYPNALHIRNDKIYETFIKRIPVDRWSSSNVDEFSMKIEDLTVSFKGREDKLKELKEYITTDKPRQVMVTGAPGVGKSALIAHMIKDLSGIGGEHYKKAKGIVIVEYFIQKGTRYAERNYYLQYINQRLEKIFGTGIKIGTKPEEMADGLYKRLQKISQKIKEGFVKDKERITKLVLCIDGLDEANDLLPYIPVELYNNIVTIVSSRPTPQAEELYLQRFDREARRKVELHGLQREDIRALLYDVTNKYQLQEEYVEAVLERSQGNPLYLNLLCDELIEKKREANDVSTLPGSIKEFYNEILQRLGNEAVEMLWLLAVARDYITAVQAGEFLGIGVLEAEKRIHSAMEVLSINSNKSYDAYQLFHDSLRDYLWDNYRAMLIVMEKRIVETCTKWRELIGKKEKREILEYILKYYCTHLEHLGDLEEKPNLKPPVRWDANEYRKKVYDLILNEEYRQMQKQYLVSRNYALADLERVVRMIVKDTAGEAGDIIDEDTILATGNLPKLAQIVVTAANEANAAYKDIIIMILQYAKHGKIQVALELLDIITDDNLLLYISILLLWILVDLKINQEEKKRLITLIVNKIDETVVPGHFYKISNLDYLLAYIINKMYLLGLNVDFIRKICDSEDIYHCLNKLLTFRDVDFELVFSLIENMRIEASTRSVVQIITSFTNSKTLNETDKCKISEYLNKLNKVYNNASKTNTKLNTGLMISKLLILLEKKDEAFDYFLNSVELFLIDGFSIKLFKLLINAYTEFGEKKYLTTLIDQILKVSENVSDTWKKGELLTIASKLLIQIGDRAKAAAIIEETLCLVENIDYENNENELYFNISNKDIIFRKRNEVSLGNRYIKHVYEKNFLICTIAILYNELGYDAKVNKLLIKAIDLAKSINNLNNKISLMTDICKAIIEMNKYEFVDEVVNIIIDIIKSDFTKEELLIEGLIDVLVSTGNIERAIDVINNICISHQAINLGTVHLASWLVSNGDIQKAKEVIRYCRYPDGRVETINSLVQIIAKTRNKNEVKKILEEIDDDLYHNSSIFLELINIIAECCKKDDAIELIEYVYNKSFNKISIIKYSTNDNITSCLSRGLYKFFDNKKFEGAGIALLTNILKYILLAELIDITIEQNNGYYDNKTRRELLANHYKDLVMHNFDDSNKFDEKLLKLLSELDFMVNKHFDSIVKILDKYEKREIVKTLVLDRIAYIKKGYNPEKLKISYLTDVAHTVADIDEIDILHDLIDYIMNLIKHGYIDKYNKQEFLVEIIQLYSKIGDFFLALHTLKKLKEIGEDDDISKLLYRNKAINSITQCEIKDKVDEIYDVLITWAMEMPDEDSRQSSLFPIIIGLAKLNKFEKCKELLLTLNNINRAKALLNIFNLFYDKHEKENAQIFLDQAIEVIESINVNGEIDLKSIYVLAMLAEAYQKIGDNLKAIQYIDKMYQYIEKVRVFKKEEDIVNILCKSASVLSDNSVKMKLYEHVVNIIVNDCDNDNYDKLNTLKEDVILSIVKSGVNYWEIIENIYIKKKNAKIAFIHSILSEFRYGINCEYKSLPFIIRTLSWIPLDSVAAYQGIYMLLLNFAYHGWFDTVANIALICPQLGLADIFEEYRKPFSYDTLDEWLETVPKKSYREQIQLWAKWVKEGELTRGDFEEKVQELLK